MTFKFAAVSLVALGLFLSPVVAQDNQTQPAAEQPAEVAAPAALPEEVLALINDRRTSQELSDEDLKARARQARKQLKAEALPDDIKAQLQALMDADRAELETRAQAQAPSLAWRCAGPPAPVRISSGSTSFLRPSILAPPPLQCAISWRAPDAFPGALGSASACSNFRTVKCGGFWSATTRSVTSSPTVRRG